MSHEKTPLIDLRSTFDATLLLGSVELPVHIKRLSRAEMEKFEKDWAAFIVEPRGADEVAALRQKVSLKGSTGYIGISTMQIQALLKVIDEPASQIRDAAGDDKLQADTLAYIERTLREALTIDEGLVRNNDKWVVDGAGFIEAFHARKDVLVAAMTAIAEENRLSSVLRKNSKSLPVSDGGSAASAQTTSERRPGAEPERTADDAGPKDSANGAAATDGQSQAAASGEIPKVH